MVRPQPSSQWDREPSYREALRAAGARAAKWLPVWKILFLGKSPAFSDVEVGALLRLRDEYESGVGRKRLIFQSYTEVVLKMAAPKLNAEQVNKIKELLAADETLSNIAKEIGCHIQTVKYYSAKFSDEIEEARKVLSSETISRGLANKDYRIRKLARLAQRIEKSIEEKTDGGKGLWVDDVKLSASGETVDIEVFAGEAIRQYRGILDDIAKETGGRVSKSQVTIEKMSNDELVKLITGEA